MSPDSSSLTYYRLGSYPSSIFPVDFYFYKYYNGFGGVQVVVVYVVY